MKKMIAILVLALATATLCLTGCGKQAQPITLPSASEIDFIDIATLDGSELSCSDEKWIAQFLAVLSQAEGTTRASVQDAPQIETYGKVDIANNGGTTTFFYYIEGEKYYIEQPYQGIYTIDADIDALAKGLE